MRGSRWTVGTGMMIALSAAASGAFVGGWGASKYQYAIGGYDAFNPSDLPILPTTGCRVMLSAADNVILPGESGAISAWARVPGGAYAFAAAEFDVAAEMPAWTAASAGVIIGADVNGISVGQSHNPFAGVFADPDNPLRIWSGLFTPASYDPRYVEVKATPSAFSYYPSELTASVVDCDAAQGRLGLFINPYRLGDAIVAPGAGTTIEVVGEGAIEAQSDGGVSALVAAQLPKKHKVRVAPADLLTEFEVRVGTVGDDMPMEVVSFNYSQSPNSGFYAAQVDWESAAYYEIRLYKAAQVDFFLRLQSVDGEATGWSLGGLPDTFSNRVERVVAARQTHVVSELGFDEPVVFTLPNGARYEADRIEVRAVMNNLRQIGLGVHTFESHGAGGGGGAGKVSYSDMCCY